MKIRLSFALLVTLLAAMLVVALMPSLEPAFRAVAASGTPTSAPSPTGTPSPSASPTWPLVSPTSIPLQPTYTSIPAETPELSASQTLLPIQTPTLLMAGSQTLLPISTATLAPFPTMTPTAFGRTATPPVPIAFTTDGKPQSCYKGPSLAYATRDMFAIAQIVGKDAGGGWWYLLVYKGNGIFVYCWASGEQVTTGGNLGGLSVIEPDLPAITQVEVHPSGQPATGTEYVQTIVCDGGKSKTTLHVTGLIFADGPLARVGYAWRSDAPAQLEPGHAAVSAWDAPAQIRVDLSVPAQAGSYSLSLRTTFPLEVVGTLRFTLRCN